MRKLTKNGIIENLNVQTYYLPTLICGSILSQMRDQFAFLVVECDVRGACRGWSLARTHQDRGFQDYDGREDGRKRKTPLL